jgi:hypothetical protein
MMDQWVGAIYMAYFGLDPSINVVIWVKPPYKWKLLSPIWDV